MSLLDAKVPHAAPVRAITTTKRASPWRWKGLIVMCAGLVVGMAVAGVHMAFYSYMDHKVVRSSAQQQWVIRGGTALATAFKIIVGLSIGLAYTQVMWSSLQKRDTLIMDFDAIYNAHANIAGLLDLRRWMARLDLLGIIVVSWLMVLVAVVTPGSITVVSGVTNSTVDLHLPEINFLSSPFAVFQNNGSGSFPGVFANVLRISNAVAFGAKVLPMSAPLAGSSYSLDFTGPAMKCAQSTERQMSDFLQIQNEQGIGGGYQYVAWSQPCDDSNCSSISAVTVVPSFGQAMNWADWESGSFVQTVFVYYAAGQDGIMVGCSLQNATYSLQFDFWTNSTSHILIRNISFLTDGESLLPQGFPVAAYGTVAAAPRWWCYYSMLIAYWTPMIGYISVNPTGATNATTYVQSTAIGGVLSGLTLATDTVQGADALITGLEGLFTNFTLSLFSDSSLLFNSNETTPALVNVTQTQNFYEFSKRSELYSVYAAAIACASICVALGTWALFRSNGEYTKDPSTVLRLHRDPALIQLLSTDHGEEDLRGARPLPEHLAHVKVRLDLRGDASTQALWMVVPAGKEEVTDNATATANSVTASSVIEAKAPLLNASSASSSSEEISRSSVDG